MIQQNYLGQGSKTGLLIIMSWCVFSLVWISFYTSQLTALLSTESMSPQYVDIQALDDVSWIILRCPMPLLCYCSMLLLCAAAVLLCYAAVVLLLYAAVVLLLCCCPMPLLCC